MSLTSYRAAPSRVRVDYIVERYFTLLARFGDALLSHTLRCSTIGATVLNFRVRDGTGCFTRAMITKPSKQRRTILAQPIRSVCGSELRSKSRAHPVYVVRYRIPSQYTVCCVCFWIVHSLTCFHVYLLLDQIKPIGPLVPVN